MSLISGDEGNVKIIILVKCKDDINQDGLWSRIKRYK